MFDSSVCAVTVLLIILQTSAVPYFTLFYSQFLYLRRSIMFVYAILLLLTFDLHDHMKL